MISQRRLEDLRRELLKAQSEIVAALNSEKSRKRADMNRKLHEVRQMLTPAYAFMSQAGQDVAVDRYFNHMESGTFIDVGGYDGVTGSNTVFLEKWRKWTGVLVEPVEVHRARAEKARSCPCLGYAVAGASKMTDFLEVTGGYTQMGGLCETYNENVLQQVRKNPQHQESIFRIETKPLAEILQEADIQHPDFVSLDIGGGELVALEAFPFQDHRVGIWAIENNRGTRALNDLMRGHGYDLIDFCGRDEIYALHKA